MTIRIVTSLCILALLAMAQPQAQQKPTSLLEYQKKQLPPPEFDHGYDGELTLLRVPEPVVHEKCRMRLTEKQQAVACSQRAFGGSRCTIWIITDAELKKRGWDYDLVLRHELGHCAGWIHEYPKP